MPLLLPVLPPPHHLSTAHARLQLVTRSGQPPHTKAPGDFKQVPGTSRSAPCPPLSQPRSRPGPLPAPAMAPGAPSPSPSPVLAALLFSSVGKWGRPSLEPGSGRPQFYPRHQRETEQEQEGDLIFREKQSLEGAVTVFRAGRWKAISELPGGADRTRLGTNTTPQGRAEGLQEAPSLRWDQDQTPGFWSLLVP